MSYFRLFRLPNLIIIVITQYLLRFCVIKPIYQLGGVNLMMSELDFALLVLSTLLIAAAGYVINDFYDIDIDSVNKPGKNIVALSFSVNKVYIIYAVLNVVAIVIGFYLSSKINSYQVGFIFVAIIGMLWYYSSRYKRMFLVGNLIVSFLSAMVILIVWLFEFMFLRMDPNLFVDAYKYVVAVNPFIWGYAIFAFVVTLAREIIKDVHDIEGDRRHGCRTMPVVLGVRKIRWIIYALVVVILMLLAISQNYLFAHDYPLVAWYLLITVDTLLIYLFIKTIKVPNEKAYNLLSNIIKIIMVAGILSMELVCISI